MEPMQEEKKIAIKYNSYESLDKKNLAPKEKRKEMMQWLAKKEDWKLQFEVLEQLRMENKFNPED